MLSFLVLVSLSSSNNLDSIANDVNSRNDISWRAHVSPRFRAMSEDDLRHLNGAWSMPEDLRNYKYVPIRNDIPAEFDAAARWSNCPTLSEIYDQGNCGSCWAFSTFQSLQDRFCIQSNATKNPKLSAQHLVSCATGCNGCFGGWPSRAFDWIKQNGLTVDSCIPYQMGHCKHPSGCTYRQAPKCNATCFPEQKAITEKHYAASQKSIRAKEEIIQSELMTYGPVTAVFTVYQDFATYSSGVYHHVTGSQLGLHAVTMTGWGVLNGEKYWKIKNSWNTDFGMNGTFLIKRGTNECGIEAEIVAGMPKL